MHVCVCVRVCVCSRVCARIKVWAVAVVLAQMNHLNFGKPACPSDFEEIVIFKKFNLSSIERYLFGRGTPNVLRNLLSVFVVSFKQHTKMMNKSLIFEMSDVCSIR